MENKKQVGGSSSSMSTMDHLFGPKDPPSASSSSSTGLFGSIFPPPSTVLGRDSTHNQGARVKSGNPDFVPQNSKGTENGGVGTREKGPNYENETTEPCYFSSSIYYGGQENYSPRTRSTESPQITPTYTRVLTDDEEGGFPYTGRSAERNASCMIHRQIMNPFFSFAFYSLVTIFLLHFWLHLC